MRLVLLHPPLLSGVVWRRLAPLLLDAGHDVVAPALTWSDENRWHAEATHEVVRQVGDADAVVAHSGAGALLPGVLAALPSASHALLVDAVLPPRSGFSVPPDRLRTFVAGLATSGRLPPWTEWWGDDVMAELVPDSDDRASLSATAPRLSPRFFDVAVPVPENWEPAGRAYLRLSDAYDEEALEAAARGWAVERLDGQHLDPLARPHDVAAAVLRLLI